MADVASTTVPATSAPVAPPPAAAEAPAATTPAGAAKTAHAAPRAPKVPAHFTDKDGLFKNICRFFMNKKCTRGASCHHVHDKQLCSYFYHMETCKHGDECRKNHFVTIPEKKSSGGEADEKDASGVTDAETSDTAAVDTGAKKSKKPREKNPKDKKKSAEGAVDKEDASGKPKETSTPTSNNKNGNKKSEANGESSKPKTDGKKTDAKKKQQKARSSKKNTECFDLITKPVDLRVTYDLGSKNDKFSTSLTTRDVLLVPSLFSDFKKGELYAKLVAEIESCGIPPERLLKMWHGNDKIDGTHLIADDKTRWKNNCPTFDLVIDSVKKFFNMSVKATRFSWPSSFQHFLCLLCTQRHPNFGQTSTPTKPFVELQQLLACSSKEIPRTKNTSARCIQRRPPTRTLRRGPAEAATFLPRCSGGHEHPSTERALVTAESAVATHAPSAPQHGFSYSPPYHPVAPKFPVAAPAFPAPERCAAAPAPGAPEPPLVAPAFPAPRRCAADLHGDTNKEKLGEVFAPSLININIKNDGMPAQHTAQH